MSPLFPSGPDHTALFIQLVERAGLAATATFSPATESFLLKINTTTPELTKGYAWLRQLNW